MHTTILTSIILAFAATASASTITFSDGTFTTGTWVGAVAAQNGTITSSSFLFTQGAPGVGGVGTYEDDVHSFTGTNAGMRIQNFDAANTYTGSVDRIDYSYSLEDPGIHNVGYSIAVLQGTNLYTGPIDTTLAGSSWTPFFGSLRATDFCKVNADITLDCSPSGHPVFGPPTEFGYLVGNSFVGTGTANYHSGIDNWSVTVVTPEPSSLAIYCAAGLVFALRRFRRKGSKPSLLDII